MNFLLELTLLISNSLKFPLIGIGGVGIDFLSSSCYAVYRASWSPMKRVSSAFCSLYELNSLS